MADWEPFLRVGAFVLVFLLMALWEWRAPRRAQQRWPRWRCNLALVLFNTALLRILLPGITVAAALVAARWEFGLTHWFSVPAWLALPAAVVILDLAIYWQHRLFHQRPLLWRLHRMHHTDTSYDVTTGLRFHPIEMLISAGLKVVLILLLGASAWAVVVFEVVLNAMAMFNHSNVSLPPRVDAVVRRLLVTPDMHRTHHSVLPTEHHRNFGFNLSIWDRLFDSYIAQPKAGHDEMVIGLPYFRDERELRIGNLLTQPFRLPTVNEKPKS